MMANVQRNQKFDIVLWGLIAILLVGGIAANYIYYSQSLTIRLVAWLLLACVLGALTYYTTQGYRIWVFFQEARAELRKVVWPTRKEVLQTTLLVIAMVVLVALLLWAIDSMLLWVIGLLTGQRG